MKKGGIILLFLFTFSQSFSQSTFHQQNLDTFLLRFKTNDFQSIYESFSTKMKKAKTEKYYLGFLKMIKQNHGNIKDLQLQNYNQFPQNRSHAIYQAAFDIDNLTIKISFNGNQEITGLFFQKDKINL